MPIIRIHLIEASADGTGRLFADVEALDDEGQSIPGLRSTVAVSQETAKTIFDAPSIEESLAMIVSLAHQINPMFAPDYIAAFLANNAAAAGLVAGLAGEVKLPLDIPFKV